uniref:NADH-ubiquinone oxidoreductase chain 2 n=1 Tax=Paratoxodera polyacantha TaxID=2136287 RepID=A0A343VYS9_9NEOP|nr:NADH dehydrogenase subunit 2 [Paratoxodera polyacantha]AVQ55065.1 NADH dehydrogenase subunit 2 [Paratoxodera polyacantha]
MPNNSTKILFLMTLISGTLISLSANSWLGAWMGLEINLLSFIPLLSTNKNMYSTEASLKYFLIQAIATSSILFMILVKINMQELFYFTSNNSWNNIIILPFFLKMAVAPFHWWLPSVVEGLTWSNCYIILSIQKIAPFVMISYLVYNNFFIQMTIMLSALIGAIGGLNQISLRKILAFSSINHIGWMLMTMVMGANLWILYFAIYMINVSVVILMTGMLNISFITQMFNSFNNKKLVKFTLLTSMLSLGGLPPFLGFFPKWIAINFMMQNLFMFSCFILIMSSLLTLYYYMRLMYATLMITNSENLWFTWVYPKMIHNHKLIMFNLTVVLLGMMTSNLLLLTY